MMKHIFIFEEYISENKKNIWYYQVDELGKLVWHEIEGTDLKSVQKILKHMYPLKYENRVLNSNRKTLEIALKTLTLSKSKFDPTQSHWYHGNKLKFNTFKRRFGRFTKLSEYSNEEDEREDEREDEGVVLGPGIYFTISPSEASYYAGGGYVYDTTMDIKSDRIITDRDKSNRVLVERLISLAPGRKTGTKTRYKMDDSLFGAINDVYNDFYKGDPGAFARSMVEIGYDAYLFNDEWLVVWNPDVINIVKIVPASKYERRS